jgi:DNA-binding response OmpR family regulator
MTLPKMAGEPSTKDLNRSSEVDLLSRTGAGATANDRARVLVIKHEMKGAHISHRALRALDLESSWVRGGGEGIAALRRGPFDVVLIDEELPDMASTDVIRTLRAEFDSRRFVIVRGTSTKLCLEHASSHEAPRVLDEPYRCIDLIAAINAVLKQNGGNGRSAHTSRSAEIPHMPPSTPISPMTAGSVAERWAGFVLGAIDAESDPRTVDLWARAVGVSRTVLTECCRLVHVSAHDARDFARLVRAVCHSFAQWQPEAVLDLADARTLKRLQSRAGLAPHASSTPTMPQFLDQQQWIPKANPGLIALRSLLFDAPW